MKRKQNWKKVVPLTVSFWLASGTLALAAYATNIRTQINRSSNPPLAPSGNESVLQLAQAFPNNCAEVVPPNGLYVRREPSVYSEAIGIVDYRSYLTTEGGGTETWLPISAPLKGYVWRAWVAPCYVVPEVRPVVPDVEAVPGVEF